MPKDAKNKNDKKHFFKDFKAELKKVIWPTPKQLLNNTIAVVTIVLITAAIVFVLDLVFEKMNTYGVNKIKEAVDSKNEISNEVVVDEQTEAQGEEENTSEQTETTEEATPAETSEETETENGSDQAE